MKKKIIGYKLNGKATANQVATLLGCSNHVFSDGRFFTETHLDGHTVKRAKKLGVLDLWFEPIYEEVKPIFKVGDWVITTTVVGSHLNKHKKGEVFRVINMNGPNLLFEPYGGVTADRCRLATDGEIIAYLTIEALKRYPDGTKINQEAAYNGLGGKYKISGRHVACSPTGTKNDFINVSIGGVGVYSTEHNVWAEILPTTTPDITINGYKAEFHKDWVQFGCQKIDLDFVTKLRELAKNGVTLIDNSEDDLIDEMDQIYDYLTNN